MHRVVLLLGAFLVCANVGIAANPPAIDRLSPPGGQRGTTVNAKLVGKAGDGLLQFWTDRGEMTFELSEKKDSVAVTIPAEAVPGLHWIRFHNEAGATDLRPFIVGLVPEVAETEPNGAIEEANPIELPSTTINGVLEKSGDADVYSVTLQAGDVLVASMQANRDLGSPMDAVLQVVDTHGTVVAQNDDDHGMDPQIAYTVPKDGTYFVRTFAFPSAPNSTIKLAGAATYVYRLTLTTGPFADAATPAVINGAAASAVTLHGWNLAAENAAVSVPQFEGDVFTVVESLSMPFHVARVNHLSLVEEVGTMQTLEIPASVSGQISQADEKDVYLLSGTKGQKLTITASARAMYSLLDPVVTVSTADGKVLKQADDRSKSDLDAEAQVTLPADGRYNVEVTDRYGDGGPRFSYVLTCIETTASLSATLTANSFVLQHDKSLEIPVALTRSNGFSEPVAVSIDGLPDGITVEPVTSEKDGDSAKKVTLKVSQSETTAAFSGVVRVVCQPAGGQATVARAPIQNSTATTADLWLTVIPPPKKEPEPDPPEAAASPK